MHKIASPQELKLELQTLIKLAESPRPSREALAQGLQSLAIALKKGSASKAQSPFMDSGSGTLRDKLVAALKEFYETQDDAIRAAKWQLDRLIASRDQIDHEMQLLANSFPDTTFRDLDQEMTKFPDYDRPGSWDSSLASNDFIKLTQQLDLALKASMVDGEFEGDEDWLNFVLSAAGARSRTKLGVIDSHARVGTTELAGLRSSVLEHLEALDRMIGKPNKAMYDLKDAYAENRDQKSEWLVEKAILSLLHARDDVRDLKSFLNKQTEKARGRIDDEGRQIFPKD
jgi:hypothetical protein